MSYQEHIYIAEKTGEQRGKQKERTKIEEKMRKKGMSEEEIGELPAD